MAKLFVIGDSFSLSSSYAHKNFNEDVDYWPRIIEKKLKFDILFVDADPSRDCQTIIDQWIKTIPKITDKDKLIICLPYFNRTRLPLIEKEWVNVMGDGKTKIKSQFIGTHSYNRKVSNLEIWGNFYDSDFFINRLEIQEFINCSYASITNFYEIIDSLLLLTKAKTILFTWDCLQYKNPKIIDKEALTNEIGFWETIHDVFQKTNGENGASGDYHWSTDMNRAIAKFLIEKINN